MNPNSVNRLPLRLQSPNHPRPERNFVTIQSCSRGSTLGQTHSTSHDLTGPETPDRNVTLNRHLQEGLVRTRPVVRPTLPFPNIQVRGYQILVIISCRAK